MVRSNNQLFSSFQENGNQSLCTCFTTETNASGTKIGAMLSYNKRLVSFLCQAFSSYRRIKSLYEKKLFTIVNAFSKWKYYLTEKYFVTKIGQRSLKHMLDQKVVSTIQQRWAAKLIGLNYRIEYKSRIENRVTDALFR